VRLGYFLFNEDLLVMGRNWLKLYVVIVYGVDWGMFFLTFVLEWG